jgi:acyl-CoA thioester hydrolase
MQNPIQAYQMTFFASWGDMDFNAHMRNTAYLDKSADTRMRFFSENGFPMNEFIRLKVGPIIARDDIEYFREIGLLEELKVTLTMAALSVDGRRWIMRNEFYRADGKLAARVSSTGGWLDLSTRKLVVAPDKLLEILNILPKTADFTALETIVK